MTSAHTEIPEDDAAATDPEAVVEYLPEYLVAEVNRRAPRDAAKYLESSPDMVVASLLSNLDHVQAHKILAELPAERIDAIYPAIPKERSQQWLQNQCFQKDTVGWLMDAATAVFAPEDRVQQVVERLRHINRKSLVTYCYITEQDGKLCGAVTMRDLLLSEPTQSMQEIMLRDPFYLSPEMSPLDAMRKVLYRQYPVYPVCDHDGVLIGIIRGYYLFEEQAFEITAQAGRMVGIDKEERLTTSWYRSLLFRHPWLQLNLLTAFVAAAVVGVFEDTINQIVALAVFLPVLAGQSGNTGCQALAVTLRGMTLGELKPGQGRRVAIKEAWLGLLNGSVVGVTAGAGMFIYATVQNYPSAWLLSLVVFVAMTISCIVSGISGSMIPMVLKRLGADPATASSIFLTTATDVASMGVFLWLATALVL